MAFVSFGDRAIVQRCQVHKARNVRDHLPELRRASYPHFRGVSAAVLLRDDGRNRRSRGPSGGKDDHPDVILRREETAATRSLANTAHVMAEQPVLLRLKELEALKEIASHIHEVRVVVGADGLKTLLPAGLLGNGGGKVEPKPGE